MSKPGCTRHVYALIVTAKFQNGRWRKRCVLSAPYPLAPSYRRTPLESCYRAKENEKKRSYDERIREVEGGTFAPLVFSTSGGVGPSADATYKRLATLIAEKRNQSYSTTIRWIRCRLTFALIRSAILCLRGHRSRQGRPDRSDQWRATDLDMIVATAESHI